MTEPIRTERAVGTRGFSRWVQPRMAKYLMACCDCGLVHEMQFRVVSRQRRRDAIELRAQFRVRRAEGHTRKQRAALTSPPARGGRDD